MSAQELDSWGLWGLLTGAASRFWAIMPVSLEATPGCLPSDVFGELPGKPRRGWMIKRETGFLVKLKTSFGNQKSLANLLDLEPHTSPENMHFFQQNFVEGCVLRNELKWRNVELI